MDVKIDARIPREEVGIPCPCGGYADRVACTEAEMREYNCSASKSWECCARAFECRLCGTRLVGTAESPEWNDG